VNHESILPTISIVAALSPDCASFPYIDCFQLHNVFCTDLPVPGGEH